LALLSEMDTGRFGFPVGKDYGITSSTLAAVLDESACLGLRLLLARCPAADWATVHALESNGFQLMDTLVYLRRPLHDVPPASGVVAVRTACVTEAHAVGAVAREAFADYLGHYNTDRGLDPVKVAEIYPSWAEHAVADRAVADQVLVAEVDGRIAGFGAMKRVDGNGIDGILYGVAPAHRERGIYRELLCASLEAARSAGAQWMEYSTQLANVAAQRTVSRLGFVPNRAFYTFHRWFDR
jgi:GNAT superfamily N-acetyltransferase